MSAKVTLLTYTPNPEMTVAMAAKLCYSPSEISNIRDGLTEEKTADFIDMLEKYTTSKLYKVLKIQLIYLHMVIDVLL